MKCRSIQSRTTLVVLFAASLLSMPAWAADEAPDALIRRLYAEIMNSIKNDKTLQAGDMTHALDWISVNRVERSNWLTKLTQRSNSTVSHP